MNKTNLAMPSASAKRIAPKSSQSELNCKAEIERIDFQISEAEKELSLLRLSNKTYTQQDLERKNKLELNLDDLRSLLCQFITMSKFEVGMWVINGTPTPGQVKGLSLVHSYPRVAVLYDDKEEVKHERPAQLTIVDQAYLEYIWTGEDYPKLIRRGDQKECIKFKVLEENYFSAINTRDTYQDCDAAIEDIELYDKQAVWCKKQYLKITRDLFAEGTRVRSDKTMGTVLPYSERNPAYLQKVEVKLDNGDVKQFYPTEISIYPENQESSIQLGKQAKIIEFCSKPTIVTIPIADIRRDGGTQQRTALNHETAQEYGLAMRQGDEFPPVKLKYDGTNYWLIDGFHTTEAAWSIGKESIEAEVSTGSQRDAILASVGVNSRHGLQRSNADKRRAVTTLLLDPEWEKWSDREIAKHCKVDHKTVGKIRKELTGDFPSDNQKSYNDRYNNVSQMNIKNIGSNNKQKVLTVEPENAGNKELVKQFGIGQLVKLQLSNFDGVSETLRLANHSYGQITALTENQCSFNVKIFGNKSFVVSPQDIQPVNSVSFCVEFSPKQFIALMSIYQSRNEIENAIKKGVLN